MSNWIDNHVEIRTENPALIKLISKLRVKNDKAMGGIMAKIRPCALEQRKTTWGCNLDFEKSSRVIISEEESGFVSLIIDGQTQWNAPNEFLSWVFSQFNTDEYETTVYNTWLELGGRWGDWVDGGYVNQGLITSSDYVLQTEAYQLLNPLFDLDSWFEKG